MTTPESPESLPLEAPTFGLIVGLGNPGREYAFTRHNIGFMIADRLAARAGLTFSSSSKWEAEVARGGAVVYCKPLTYMNLSGKSVAAIASYHRISPERILLISDDAALPLGRLRMRLRGTAGGHNGLQSVFEHLGTDQVPRLRVGVGETEQRATLKDHVLGRFLPGEMDELQPKLERAVEAIEFAQKNSTEAAMNIYNANNT